jgi:hypothetical protein
MITGSAWSVNPAPAPAVASSRRHPTRPTISHAATSAPRHSLTPYLTERTAAPNGTAPARNVALRADSIAFLRFSVATGDGGGLAAYLRRERRGGASEVNGELAATADCNHSIACGVARQFSAALAT